VALLGVVSQMSLPANADTCPNETLRVELRSGQLPDCRAYELVTPAYKEGTVVSSVFAISPDGSRLIGSSFGVLAGAGNDQLGGTSNLQGAAYQLSRTQDGWETSALAPPASQYVNNGMFDASADLESTLWELRALHPADGAQPPAPGVTDLYLKQPLGKFTEIGRATPDPNTINEAGSGGAKYTYVGESGDLSRVLFTTPAGLHWPFDETVEGGSTLYEYVGIPSTEQEREAREPLLVGVSGSVGSRALVSRCGTRLGSSTSAERNGSMDNAISQSGARIFFTAVGADDSECLGGPPAQPPVDELLLREETPETEGRHAEARTVPISCPTTPLSECADANFEGASQSGTKVFFTSTERLLDGASEDHLSGDSAVSVRISPTEEKGGCAETKGSGGCNLYEDELSGSGSTLTQRLILVSEGSPDPQVQGVARISADGSHIYFVAKSELAGKNSEGRMPEERADNLYVHNTLTGATSFVATLFTGDTADWQRADNRPVLASSTGNYLVFTSVADLKDEGVSGGKPQVFQYDAETERLVRASIGQYGYNNDGRTPAQGFVVEDGPPLAYSYFHNDSPTVAVNVMAPEDGEVFFKSPDALTPQALNDQPDTAGGLEPNIYEYREGNVYLLSDGHDVSSIFSNPAVNLLGSDQSGANVFFSTSDALVPQDTDTEQDIYDAHVEGGFPAPKPAMGCGEACQGPLSAASLLPTATSTAQAEGNVEQAPAAQTKTKPKKSKRKAARASRPASRKKKARKTGHSSRARRGVG
jgi:hypothetical protein